MSTTTKPSPSAMRAAELIAGPVHEPLRQKIVNDYAQIIDHETGLKELVEALEEARDALNWYADESYPVAIGALKRVTAALAKVKEGKL